MTPRRKIAKKGSLYIELDGTKYETVKITKTDVIKFVEEFRIGKFKVQQNDKNVRPSKLNPKKSVKIVREDKAAI